METLEGLKRRIRVAEELLSVVSTMKALAAVSIRQYEDAVRSLRDYNRTIELGLRIVLRKQPEIAQLARTAPRSHPGAIVIGTDQGMCGPLNEQIVEFAIRHFSAQTDSRQAFVVGIRAASRLEERGVEVTPGPPVPNSTEGITNSVLDMLLMVENWTRRNSIDAVWLYHAEHRAGATYQPRAVPLLPIDYRWLSDIASQEWPTRMLPLFTVDGEELFLLLVQQYLFVSLYRALAESLASENAGRLAAMQNAEHNIEDRLAELRLGFHRERQASITGELLDIISGFEALSEGDARGGD